MREQLRVIAPCLYLKRFYDKGQQQQEQRSEALKLLSMSCYRLLSGATAYRYVQYPAWQSFDCPLFIPRSLHFVNLCHLMKLGIRNEEWIFFKSMQHSKIVTN